MLVLTQYDEALAAYDKAVSINPNFAEAWYNRANVLLDLKKYHEAIASYDEAISNKNDFVEAWSNRGLVLF